VKAFEITSCSGDRKRLGTGEEMKKGFLLYGVDIFTYRFSIHHAIESACPVFPYSANSFLTLLDSASVITKGAV
jgi:hypothetical protein